MQRTLLALLLALGWTTPGQALPTDPTTVHGQVQIQNGQNLVQILQQTPQAIINWGQFNIGLGETVRFLQPSQQAAILNRVIGQDPSVIQGLLQANGRVFLINPNGILFGPDAVVDVGSFTASTLKMSDQDFLNSTYKLTQDPGLPLRALTNQGTIQVAEGGFVVLVSPLLDNQGLILAQAGQVNLGASTQATFSVDGRGLVQFVVPDGFDPHFGSGGQAGAVLLQPGQMSQLLSQVITNSALVEAGSFEAQGNGAIRAVAAEGLLLHSGVIQAPGGAVRLDSSQASVLPTAGRLEGNEVRLLSAGKTVSSGQITADTAEVSGQNVWLQGMVQANHLLLDPVDITIIDAPNGGTFDGGLPNPTNGGSGTVSVGALQNQTLGSITLNADHDVIYNGSGFNLTANALNLIAGNDINIHFNNTGSIIASSLSLQAGHDVLVSVNGSGGLTASSGDLTVTGGNDVRMSANGDLILGSPTLARITATSNDLVLTSAVVNSNFTTALNGGGSFQLNAGHDLTLTQPRLSAGASSITATASNDVTIQQGNGSSFIGNARSLNVQAGRNFTGRATSGDFSMTTSSGDLQVVATGTLLLSPTGNLNLNSAGALVLRGASISNSNAQDATLAGTGQTVVNATGGDVNLSGSGNLRITSASARTAVNASNDIRLSAGGDIVLSSPTLTRVTAGNDANLHSSTVQANFTTFLNGPDTAISAVHDLILNQPNLSQSGPTGAVALAAGNDLSLLSSTTQVNTNVGSLQLQAGRDVVGQSTSGIYRLHAINGDLSVSGGRNVTLSSPNSSLTLVSDLGATRLTGQDVNLSGRDLSLNAQGETVINATNGNFRAVANPGDLVLHSTASRVAVNATNGNVTMTAGGDIKLESGTTTTVNSTGDIGLTSSTVQTNFTTFLSSPSTSIGAGRNLTLNQPNLNQSVAGSVSLSAGNDVSLTSPRQIDSNLSSLNVQAGHDLIGQAASGQLRLNVSNGLSLGAARNVQLSAPGQALVLNAGGALNVTAQDITASGNSFSGTASGATLVNATNGSVRVTASGGADLTLSSSADRLAINATNGDVVLQAGGDIKLSSATTSALNATRDINLSSATVLNGFTTFLSGPSTSIGAGRNLTMSQANLNQQPGSGPVALSAANVVTFTTPSGFMDSNLAALQVQAGQDIVGQASSGGFRINSSGPLALQASRNLTVSAAGGLTLNSGNAAPLSLSAANVDLGGSGVALNGSGATSLTAGDGSVKVRASGGSNLNLQGTSVSVNATNGDVDLAAGGDLRLQSSNNSVNATQDVKRASGTVRTNITTFLLGPTTIQAGRDADLSQPNLNQSGGALVLRAGNDLTLRNDAGGLNAPLTSLDAQAGGDLRIRSNSGFNLLTTQGLSLVAAGNLSFTSGGLQNTSGSTNISGGNVALENVGLTFNGGDVNLHSAGNLSVGSLNTNASANTTLSGGNISLQSMQLISGGNYTITTPGNLTEASPATNPPTLAALNLTAGNAFGLSATNSSFSIPRTASAGNLTGLVTAGNDTVLHASSSFRNFNGANFQPGHIDHQTGDIYVDGLLFYSGLAPVNPPPPPPTPPPIPSLPSAPDAVVAASSPSQSGVTPEQRAQILAQSNLALGNLGSFSRVLSESEQQHLTARQDSLHQTWPLDPFSPTLALAVPGGPPSVYASELASLQSLLLNSPNPEELEEKTRGAYNVIVDQELREIWEVRYWRHLLENFIIWEDRE